MADKSTPELLPTDLASELERVHGDRAIDGLFVQVSGPKMMQIIRTLRIEHSTPDRNTVLEEAAKEFYRRATYSRSIGSDAYATWIAAGDYLRALTTTPEPTEVQRSGRPVEGVGAVETSVEAEHRHEPADYEVDHGATPEPADPAGVSEMVCDACGGNGYSGGEMPADEELRGEYDFACEVCGGTGKARTPDPVLEVVKEALEHIASGQCVHPENTARAALQAINERGRS